MNYARLIVTMMAFFALSGPLAADAETEPAVGTRVLTVAAAARIATVAEQACSTQGYQVAVAVVDRYGNLLAFVRDPLAGVHTIGVAQDKAYTAASFQQATSELVERIDFLRGTSRLSLVGGGLPIRFGGVMYGAVGVSGAPREVFPGDVDERCARSGIDSVAESLEFSG